MRLKTIKLSGFKSFVDPTTFHLPSHMIGVVGPNGCGKSNIIDAVRWVMGESSPRLLRGDSMADVIFNGSNSRKPVGTATVELIFDNVEGALTGEYASYAEIAIKRMVSRDGHSQYFLNGTRCRRRDITDLFLGTGLGPRSYSIIEQGMISQLVEARPEELRGHLEEAAGISLYKERRRDTENRIRRTRENLERLEDLRSEVETQLRHLQRQAKQAVKYKQLKEEQRFAHAQLLAINWRSAAAAHAASGAEVTAADTRLQAAVADLRAVEAALEQARQEQVAAAEAVNAVQAQLYEVGGRIARLEQAIAHRQELKQRQKSEHEEALRNCEELRAHLALDQVQLTELEAEIAALEPQLVTAREAENQALDQAEQAEQALGLWQSQWQELTADSGERNRAADIERTRIDHLDRQLADTADRLRALAEERLRADTESLSEQLAGIDRETGEVQEEIAGNESRLATVRDEIGQLAEQSRDTDEQLDLAREAMQENQLRLGSLQALQKASRGEESGETASWIKAQELTEAPLLAQQLEVADGWETAAESVLGSLLDALVVDDLDRFGRSAAGLEKGQVQLVASNPAPESAAGTLASKIRGPAALLDFCRDIAVAADVEDLLARRSGLEPGQSIVAPDGTWGGRYWLRVARGDDAEGGMLAREREINLLSENAQTLTADNLKLQQQKHSLDKVLAETEGKRDDLLEVLAAQHQHRAEMAGRADGIRARLTHLAERSARIDQETSALKDRINNDEAAVREARGKLQGNVDDMALLEQRREKLEGERKPVRERHDEARRTANQARFVAHELALKLESRRAALSSTSQGLGRTRQQIAQTEARCELLLANLADAGDPSAQEETELKTELDQRLAIEQLLAQRRAAAEQANGKIADLDRQRHQLSEAQQQRRQSRDDLRLAQEGLRVKVESLSEQLTETNLTCEQLLEGVPDDADPTARAAELDRLAARITRLEPVNLAAISELEEQQERKQYLDAQNDDLTEALETLEGAIRKIDRETRTRFKETFDKVNSGIQELFPRLFGGGHAYMELVGDDLLTAGVAIMARPPGKRISNIHLLSGGEKALTAVALVFSIFRLNPAPFCMLDEVDAPLDDANVGRFSDLVNQMSEQVQFLFVTHNKITMEVAHQLLGVTMHEPGVSRLVSVDVAEAARMAAE